MSKIMAVLLWGVVIMLIAPLYSGLAQEANPVFAFFMSGVVFITTAVLLDILCEEVWRPLKMGTWEPLKVTIGKVFMLHKPQDRDHEPEHDLEVKRWRKSRFAFAMSYAAVCFYVPYILMSLLLSGIHPFVDQAMIVASVWLAWWPLSYSVKKVSVYVPEAQGFVTLNYLTGKRIIYGEGLHFRFPWETVHEKNHISLQDMTILVRRISIPTKGAKIYLSFQFTWKPRLTELNVFIQLGASTVAEKFRGIFEEFFTSRIRLMPLEVVSNGQMVLSWLARSVFDLKTEKLDLRDTRIRDIYTKMGDYIDLKLQTKSMGKTRCSLERKFGVNVTMIEVTDLDFDKDVQEARNAIDILRELGPAMRQSLGISEADWKTVYANPNDPGSHQKFLELFQQFSVITKDAKQTVVAIQGGGNQGDPLVRAALAELAAKSTDPTIQAALAQILAAKTK